MIPIGWFVETSAPGQPRRVTSKAFADYVIVSWEPPEDGAEVRGYVIDYGEGVPDVNWQYLEGHRRNVTVKNLSKKGTMHKGMIKYCTSVSLSLSAPFSV